MADTPRERLDNLGRPIYVGVGYEELMQQTKSVYKAPEEKKSDNLSETLEKVADALGDNNKQDMASAREYVDQIASLRKTLDSQYEERSKRTSNSPPLNMEEAISYLRTTSETLSDFYKAAISKSTIYVGLTSLTGGAKKSLKDVIRSALADCGLCMSKAKEESLTKDASDTANVNPPTPDGTTSASDKLANVADSKKNVGRIFFDWMKDLTALLPVFTKLTLDITNLGPKHLIPSATALNNAREQIRQLIFQTRGFGDSNREMEAVYRNVGDEASRAGVTTEVYQKMLYKNSERGNQQLADQRDLHDSINNLYKQRGKLDVKQLKDLMKFSKVDNLRVNRMKDVTTASLQTANRLNMNAETVNDTFMNWYQSLGLSSEAIQRIGLNMIQISRNTGVTGSRFENVLKTVQEMAKSLQEVGNFSGTMAEDLLETGAIAEKYGITDTWKKVVTGTRSLDSYGKLDDQTRKLVNVSTANASGITVEDVLAGKLSKGSYFKKFGEGTLTASRKVIDSEYLKPQMQFQIAKRSGLIDKNAKYENLSAKDKEKVQNVEIDLKELSKIKGMLDSDTAIALENSLFQTVGIPLGEIEKTAKALPEIGLSYDDQVRKVNDDMQAMAKAAKDAGMNLSKSQKYQELQRRSAELDTQKGMTALSGYLEAKASGSPTAKAAYVEDMKERFGDGFIKSFDDFNLGKALDDIKGKLKKQALDADFNIEDYLKEGGFEGGVEGLMKQLASDNKDIASEAMGQLTKVNQAILQAQATGQDPATRRRQKLLEIRNKILTPLLDKLIDALIIVVDKFYWLVASIGALGASFSLFKIGDFFYTLLGGRGLSSVFGRLLGGSLGKAVGPLQIAIGGLTGALEAKDAGRTTAEGVGLGMLTGGAKTGSMFSGMLGIKKDSKADKAMGVGGAAAYGALAGAALGALFGPLDIVTIPVAAAIGAVVGALVELVKILTVGTDMIPKFFGGIWDFLTGLFTLDFKKMIAGYSTAGEQLIKLVFRGIIGFVENVFLNLGTWVLKAMKAVSIELPVWLSGILKSVLDFLANNEYIGEIFKPIRDLWYAVSDAFWVAAEPLRVVIDLLIKGFEWAKEKVMSFLRPVFDAADGFNWAGLLMNQLTSTIKVAAWAIGKFLKVLLFFPTTLLKIFATVAKFVKGVLGWFWWLAKELLWNSIIPDLVLGIIKFFALLPIRIMKGLLKLGSYIASAAWEGIKMLPELLVSGITTMAGWAGSALSFIWDGLKALPGLLWNGLKALVGYLWTGLKAYYGFMWKIFTSLPKLLWDGLKAAVGMWWDGLKAAGEMLWTVLKALAGFLWTTFTALPKLLWAGFKSLVGFLWDGIKLIPEKLSSVWDYLKSDEFKQVMVSAVSKIQEAFKGFGEWLLNTIKEAWLAFKDWMANGAKKVVDKTVGVIAGDTNAVDKTIAQNTAMEASTKKTSEFVKARDSAIKDPAEWRKTKELELFSAKSALAGSATNVKMSEKAYDTERYSKFNPVYWMGGHAANTQAELALNDSRKQYEENRTKVKILENELKVGPPKTISTVPTQNSIVPPQSTKAIGSTQAKKSEANESKVADAAGNMKDMAQEALNPGSIYVHDIHVEGLLKSLFSQIIKILTGLMNFKTMYDPSGGSKVDDEISMATGLKRNSVDKIMTMDEFEKIHKLIVLKSKLEFGSGMNLDGYGKPFVDRTDDVSPYNSIDSRLYSSYEDRDTASVTYKRNLADDLNKVYDNIAAYPQIDKASARSMDYSDETKSIVSPITVTRDTVETDLERKLYGEQSSHSVILPSMTDISDYLINEQSQKLETMIYYLRSIDEKMSAGSVSNPIGSNSPRSIYSSFNELKNIGVELISGAWDLTNNHYAPSSITNEGR